MTDDQPVSAALARRPHLEARFMADCAAALAKWQKAKPMRRD